MKRPRQGAATFVLRPLVIATMVYGALCSIWFLWIVSFAEFPAVGEPGPWYWITLPEFLGITAANALFLLGLFRDFRRIRRSPVSVRRGHFAGMGVSLAVLVFVQVAAVLGAGAF